MKTVVFLLQKGQFSAVIGDKRCYLRGGESMSFVEFDSEKIVESFESSDNFKGWNDVQLFILYDGESAKYLFDIIDSFELKKKVGQCKNFSFQMKIEEEPVNLESGIASFWDEGDGSAEASAEIDKLNKEIERKNAENDELKNEIVKKEDEICSLNKHIQTLEDEIAPKDKEIEEWKKWYDDWDCYAVRNIISDGKGHIKLKKPIDTIHEIYIFSKDSIEYSKAELHWYKELKDLNDNWHFPTEKESEILLELYKIPHPQFGHMWPDSSFFSLFFGNICHWFIGDGKKCYYAKETDKEKRICEQHNYASSIFVR